MAIKDPEKLIKAARADLDKRFRQLCDEVIEEADKLFKGSKNADYNSGNVFIQDYFDCIDDPVKAAFAPCWRKALREKSLISSGRPAKNESLLVNIVDHINYLRFLYSIIRLNG